MTPQTGKQLQHAYWQISQEVKTIGTVKSD